MSAMFSLGGERTTVGAVEDRQISGPTGMIPLRIYTPEGSGPFPVLVYFHGGGWIRGGLESHDRICRALTAGADCIIVAVDYHLSPEQKYPVALHDCYTASVWAAEHAMELNGDSARLAVGGDSSGGNLAAAVTLMARDQKGPRFQFQVLIYPVTDYPEPETSSYQENGQGYLLLSADMHWYWYNYLSTDEDHEHPYVSPLRANDFSGLSPAFVLTAEYDPLRDEGEAYAACLRNAGIPVTMKRYDGMIHSFLLMDGALDQGKQALLDVAAALRAALHGE
jgi:acetyl esterase